MRGERVSRHAVAVLPNNPTPSACLFADGGENRLHQLTALVCVGNCKNFLARVAVGLTDQGCVGHRLVSVKGSAELPSGSIHQDRYATMYKKLHAVGVPN